MPTVDIDSDTAHDAAQRELNKPMYPKASLTDQLGHWLDDLLYRLILKGSQVPGGWFTIMVLSIVLAVVIVVAIRVIRRTMRTDRDGRYQLFGPTELTAAQHRATAEQCAARGDWAAAIRHRLRAVGRHLEETGTLDPVPGRTAGELARDAGMALPGLTSEFRRAATVFDSVTYGDVPGTADSYTLIADLDDHLRARINTAPDDTSEVTYDGWAQVR